MNLRAWLALSLAAPLLFSCANSAPALPASSAVDLTDVHDLLWRGKTDTAMERLNRLSWAQTGSIGAERILQDLRISRGGRGAVLSDLQSWENGHDGDPDLAYLRNRLLEDPEHRYFELREALRDAPSHDWLRLGSAATAQALGEWGQARGLLKSLQGWEDAAAFRRVILAKQLAHDEHPLDAFELLEKDAFVHGRESALLTWLQIADSYRDSVRSDRARSEIAVRRCLAWNLDSASRIDLVFARLQAEWPWLHDQDLDVALEELDRWSAVAEVPNGWSDHARYSAPPFAELVRPEPSGGGPAGPWAEAGRILLAGSAMGRGTEIHLLTGTVVYQLRWPRQSAPLEILVSDGALSASAGLPQGGAVLHGFFLRLDEAEANARAIERRLDGFIAVRPDLELQPEASSFESWDLPERLRLLEVGAGTTSRQASIAALAVHEAGHLPETLPWTRYGVPVFRLLPRFIASMTSYGDPVLWLEYRAQARALASGRATRWLMAEIVARANQPLDPYHAPYRALLRDLVDLGSEQGMPHLAHWDELDPALLSALGSALCKKEDIELLPEEGLSALETLLEELDSAQ